MVEVKGNVLLCDADEFLEIMKKIEEGYVGEENG